MSQENRKRVEKGQGGVALLDRHHEIFGIIFVLAALIVMLSLASFSPSDPIFESAGKKAHNWIGLVGAHFANGLLGLLGISSFVLVAALIYAAAVAFTKGAVPLTFKKIFGYLLLTLLGSAFLHIVLSGNPLLGHAPGGLLGEYIGGLLLSLFSTAGSVSMLLAGIFVGLIQISPFSMVQTGKTMGRAMRWLGKHCWRLMAWLGVRLGRFLLKLAGAAGRFVKREASEFVDSMRGQKTASDGMPTNASNIPMQDSENPELLEQQESKQQVPMSVFLAPPVSTPPEVYRREPVVVTSDPPPVEARPEPDHPIKKSFRDIRRDQEPEIVIPKPMEKLEKEETKGKEDPALLPTPDYKDFRLPDISLLNEAKQQEAVIEKDKLHEYARCLEGKLKDYGIDGRVTKIMPGPVVTMYEYAPGPGIKVSRIAGLSSDLALALEAMSVRIVAPIPGRAVVGIEVANKERQTVYAQEIVGNSTFQKSRSKLTLALGKDIEGAPYVADLNKMPHLLVAGATGTGKSVALNLMITSILYRNTPEEVRFIMVDPKVLELSLYDGIPHLLLPVVTDPRKANAALLWAVNEMERRIQILHAAGVRDLDGFNRKVEKLRSKEPSKAPPSGSDEQANAPEASADPVASILALDAAKPKRKVIVIDKTSERPAAKTSVENAAVDSPALEAETSAAEEENDFPQQKLPHIIIVIDELADLMMTVGRDVETSIARIAQKARAAGIHLIVATQRPSVNVITGLIKANLPARISFRVASKVDSRTILDQNGSETLLGNGDMLFHPPTTSEILRIHGALITEEEITRVVDHLKKQAQPIYDESILASAEPSEDEDEQQQDEYNDELYDMAVQIVSEMGQASTSMVQRKLRIGYNRAARLIERMEREGIVGPPDGAKPREVLISNHLP